VIFVAPLSYTFEARRRWDPAVLARAVLLAAPAVAALVALRIAVPAWNGAPAYVTSLPASVRSGIGNLPSYNVLLVARQTLEARARDWPRMTVAYAVCCFGLLGMVLPALAGRLLRPVLARFWPLLLLTLAQLLFALNTQRLTAFAFVPVIIACLCGARAAMTRLGVPGAWFALAAVTAIVLEFADRDESSPLPLHQALVLGALCAVAAAATAVTAHRRRQAISRPAASRSPAASSGR
jgi:hypothetical protein